MKKKYIIVGDNNFWYATTNEMTTSELEDVLEEIKADIKRGDYEDNSTPNELFAFEAKEIKRIKL